MLTLSESRRAVTRGVFPAPGALAGLMESVTSGVAQLIGFAAPENCFGFQQALQCFKIGQTVVKVCCSHQELSESTVVRCCSFCSS